MKKQQWILKEIEAATRAHPPRDRHYIDGFLADVRKSGESLSRTEFHELLAKHQPDLRDDDDYFDYNVLGDHFSLVADFSEAWDIAEPPSLPEFKVTVEKMDEETRAFISAGYPDNLGLRTKFGGSPDWVHGQGGAICPECDKNMTFVCQIDSFQHDSKKNSNRVDCLSDEQRFMFGDVGMIYIFLCFECMETKAVLQCH